MQKFTVKDVRRIPSADPSRLGKLDYLVTYEIDPMRTYMVTIPQDELTDELIKDAVKEDLASMAQFTGKEFEL